MNYTNKFKVLNPKNSSSLQIYENIGVPHSPSPPPPPPTHTHVSKIKYFYHPQKRSCPGIQSFRYRIGLSCYRSNNGGVETALRIHVGIYCGTSRC